MCAKSSPKHRSDIPESPKKLLGVKIFRDEFAPDCLLQRGVGKLSVPTELLGELAH